MTILVTGARGHVGRRVLEGLLAAGHPVRATSRNPKSGDFPDGVEVVAADLTDPGSFATVLDGVSKVFLYAHPQTATEFATAARGARVEHVVVLSSASVLVPDPKSNPIARQHYLVEEALRESGLEWTFVRPAYFATNALRWHTIRTERRIRTAFPDASTSMVHERDIADIALAALTDDSLRGRAFAALGAGTTTTREQIAAIADALGEPVRIDELDLETFRSELLTQLPAPIVDRFLEASGNVPPPPPEVAVDAVPELLGRSATPFTEWARDHAEDFR